MAGVILTPGRCERQGTVRVVAVGLGGHGSVLVSNVTLHVVGAAGVKLISRYLTLLIVPSLEILTSQASGISAAPFPSKFGPNDQGSFVFGSLVIFNFRTL